MPLILKSSKLGHWAAELSISPNAKLSVDSILDMSLALLSFPPRDGCSCCIKSSTCFSNSGRLWRVSSALLVTSQSTVAEESISKVSRQPAAPGKFSDRAESVEPQEWSVEMLLPTDSRSRISFEYQRQYITPRPAMKR